MIGLLGAKATSEDMEKLANVELAVGLAKFAICIAVILTALYFVGQVAR